MTRTVHFVKFVKFFWIWGKLCSVDTDQWLIETHLSGIYLETNALCTLNRTHLFQGNCAPIFLAINLIGIHWTWFFLHLKNLGSSARWTVPIIIVSPDGPTNAQTGPVCMAGTRDLTSNSCLSPVPRPSSQTLGCDNRLKLPITTSKWLRHIRIQ